MNGNEDQTKLLFTSETPSKDAEVGPDRSAGMESKVAHCNISNSSKRSMCSSPNLNQSSSLLAMIKIFAFFSIIRNAWKSFSSVTYDAGKLRHQLPP